MFVLFFFFPPQLFAKDTYILHANHWCVEGDYQTTESSLQVFEITLALLPLTECYKNNVVFIFFFFFLI